MLKSDGQRAKIEKNYHHYHPYYHPYYHPISPFRPFRGVVRDPREGKSIGFQLALSTFCLCFLI